MSETETLAARVAALETVVAEHGAFLLKLLEVPAIRLHALGVNGFPAISLRLELPPDTNPRGGSQNKEHPYDAELRRGSKLAALAQELGK